MKMNRLEEINGWDVPDRIQVHGYDMTFIPDLTRDNFNYLIEEHNKLVELVNVLADKVGIYEP